MDTFTLHHPVNAPVIWYTCLNIFTPQPPVNSPQIRPIRSPLLNVLTPHHPMNVLVYTIYPLEYIYSAPSCERPSRYDQYDLCKAHLRPCKFVRRVCAGIKCLVCKNNISYQIYIAIGTFIYNKMLIIITLFFIIEDILK